MKLELIQSAEGKHRAWIREQRHKTQQRREEEMNQTADLENSIRLTALIIGKWQETLHIVACASLVLPVDIATQEVTTKGGQQIVFHSITTKGDFNHAYS